MSEHLKELYEKITNEYDELQSIHHQIDRHGRQIKLRFRLDEIDIDRVKDDATRNYLAVRRLITRFNPN
ncbi:MAG: hypothetical protein NC548_45600 [Lachnospiraceae bacterium]|nr:hypothetical protein [Bacteroides sp.]MCM1221770.1 hypothetical protein [Lachnospiraceae bacterium]MCM1440987.1 hypothetical protein [Roseburia sp.]